MLEINQKLIKLLEDSKDLTIQPSTCSECKGVCCKRGGCQYLPSDFEQFSYDYIKNCLEEGKISITAVMEFDKDKKGSIVMNPIFMLRARNRNRDVVDFLTYQTRCSQLTKEGCSYSYDERPSFGKALIPKKDGQCYNLFESYRQEITDCWKPYQPVLVKLVEDYKKENIVSVIKHRIFMLMEEVDKELTSPYPRYGTEEFQEFISRLYYTKAQLRVPKTTGYEKIK